MSLETDFGVGAAKTGTHSLAEIFQGRIKAAHEPDSEALIRMVLQYHSRKLSEVDLQRETKRLFAAQNLRFNVSQINGFIIRTIFASYPSAHYVLTVRDAASWVRSITNHQITRPLNSASQWHAFRDLRFLRGFHPYRPEDDPLRRSHLYSLDAYLGYWVEHNINVIQEIPEPQLCIVSTRHIARDIERIASFLGVDGTDKNAGNVHVYRGDYAAGPLDQMSPVYFLERTAAYTEMLLSLASRKLGGDHMRFLQEAVALPDKNWGLINSPDRIALTQSLISEKRSDFDRWSFLASEPTERWNERAKLAASMIFDQPSVADFGCGLMYLERHLRSGTQYIPIDVVRRDKRTVVVDLNKAALPKTDAGCAVGLGLLEYIHDIATLLGSMARSYEVVLMSYVSTDFIPSREDRMAAGWVNSYSAVELEAEFERTGFQIEEKRRFDNDPLIWRLRSHRVRTE
jgi:hypothetical protein